MTDHWDYYFLRVDDQPASIFLNLGLFDEAPIAAQPHMAYVRLHMQNPRNDGLSSQEEFDALVALEDHVSAALQGKDTTFVGRCTTAGSRDFFFYIAQPDDWAARVAKALETYPDYEFDVGTREDEDWGLYFGYLYPSPMDMQSIQNRRVCEALESDGDTLQMPRAIDHYAYFRTARDADAFATAAVALGFTVKGRGEPTDTHDEFGVHLSREDTPGFDQIDAIALPLFELALEHDGEYDGWECEVVEGKPS